MNKVLEKVLRLVSKMPFGFHYALSRIAYILLFYLIRYRRQTVYSNLTNSFPNKGKKEISQIAKKFYQNFCDFIVEILKLITIDEKQLHQKISLSPQSISLMHYWYGKKRNIIVLSGHVFNWEYCIVFPRFTDYKVLVTYQPLKSKFWEKIIKSMRERFGGIAIDYKMTFREIIKYKNNNYLTLTWICGDQMPRFDSKVAANIPFLNQPTYFFNGTNSIAKKTNAVVFFLEMKKEKNKKYKAVYHLITDNPKSVDDLFIMKKYSGLLEKLIEEQPDNWLWSHKRWKNMPDPEKMSE